MTGYRIVGALRYNPAVRHVQRCRPARPRSSKGSSCCRSATRGNTVEPVSGTVRVSGPLGTRQGSVKATRILPGKRVSVPLVSAKGLPAGTYTATVTLRQGDKRFTVSKRIRVRR